MVQQKIRPLALRTTTPKKKNNLSTCFLAGALKTPPKTELSLIYRKKRRPILDPISSSQSSVLYIEREKRPILDSTSPTQSSARRGNKAREIAILILGLVIPIHLPDATIRAPRTIFTTGPIHIVNLVFRIIAQVIPRAKDLDIARQPRHRDRGILGRDAALCALGIALVVKDLGVKGDFELQGDGSGAAERVAVGRFAGVGEGGVDVGAALDDVDVGDVVLAVEAILVVVGVVVLGADAVAEFLHLELEAVVAAGGAALAGGAVGGVAGVLEGDDPVVTVGEGLGSFSAGLVGLEVEEIA